MSLIWMRGELVSVALKDCPRCHGRGWWIENGEVDKENGTMTVIYSPFCNCTEEIKREDSRRANVSVRNG